MSDDDPLSSAAARERLAYDVAEQQGLAVLRGLRPLTTARLLSLARHQSPRVRRTVAETGGWDLAVYAALVDDPDTTTALMARARLSTAGVDIDDRVGGQPRCRGVISKKGSLDRPCLSAATRTQRLANGTTIAVCSIHIGSEVADGTIEMCALDPCTNPATCVSFVEPPPTPPWRCRWCGELEADYVGGGVRVVTDLKILTAIRDVVTAGGDARDLEQYVYQHSTPV